MGLGHREIPQILQEQVDQEQRATQAALCRTFRSDLTDSDTRSRGDLNAALVR